MSTEYRNKAWKTENKNEIKNSYGIMKKFGEYEIKINYIDLDKTWNIKMIIKFYVKQEGESDLWMIVQ